MRRHPDGLPVGGSRVWEVSYHWRAVGEKLYLDYVQYRRRRVWWKLWLRPGPWRRVTVGSELPGVSVHEIGLAEKLTEAAKQGKGDGGPADGAGRADGHA